MSKTIYISYDCNSIWIKWKNMTKKRGVELTRSPVTDCYECTSHALTWNGYPKVKFNGTDYRLNRFIYCLFNQKDFKQIRNKVIRHTCDNRLCCSALHLIEGWPEDNRQDMYDRNRQAKGEQISRSKLTEADVCYILKSEMPPEYLSDVLNVTVETVNRILNRETWKHIKVEDLIDDEIDKMIF